MFILSRLQTGLYTSKVKYILPFIEQAMSGVTEHLGANFFYMVCQVPVITLDELLCEWLSD